MVTAMMTPEIVVCLREVALALRDTIGVPAILITI
jgi:hypothetical protein